MTKMLAIFVFTFFTSSLISQTAQCNKDSLVMKTNGEGIPLNRLGYTRIVLRDGSIKNKCIIKEIKEYWIVYVKDKVMHDMMIDKIKRIELEKENWAIYFDPNGKAILKRKED